MELVGRDRRATFVSGPAGKTLHKKTYEVYKIIIGARKVTDRRKYLQFQLVQRIIRVSVIVMGKNLSSYGKCVPISIFTVFTYLLTF